MSPAPALALALALALLAAAAAAATSPHDRPNTLTKANASVGAAARPPRPPRRAGDDAGGSPLLRVLTELLGPVLRLLRVQASLYADLLPQLARLVRAGAVPPFFSASAGASSGPPDAAGSSREHPKAAVEGEAQAGRRDNGDFSRFLYALVNPELQLLDRQYVALAQSVAGLSSLAGADTVAPLLASLLGATSGGLEDPAAAGTADSSEEVSDLAL